jgi:tetratricopeptide (TPR) repeat protein
MNTQEQILQETQRLLAAQQYKEAWRFLEANGEATNPTNVNTCLLGVLILEKLSEHKKALARAENWLKTKDPNNVYLLRTSGFLLNQLGRQKDALERLLRAEQITPDLKTQKIIEEIRKKRKKSFNFKELKLFKDWTDILAFMIWFIQMGLIVIFLITPYWTAIDGHPTFHTFELITDTIHSIKLSAYTGWIMALAILTIIAGMFVQHQILRPQENETIEFLSTRPIYSYYLPWFFFLLAIAASLYTNTPNFSFTQKEDLSAILGLIAIAAGGYCLYLFIPGARTRVQLIRTAGNKGNRIVIFNGVIFQSIQTYLPQHIGGGAQIKKTPFWIFTFTSNIDIELNDGKMLRLIAPSSILETRLLPKKINTLINDAIIVQGRRPENI